ncbi:hypothetical protein [Caulobacter sp. S45]|uniref:hypothetical protein n=1 Tax=Caulobacter sp. S45 TaxID=1641861 RepID=UPI00131D7F86|nr:hypothetical protein [Caulobacter sp. S45]
MRFLTGAGLGVVAMVLAGCATTQYTVAPVAETGLNVTYNQGTAIVDSDTLKGAVKVTLLGSTAHGRIRLGIAVLNKNVGPENIGFESVRILDAQGAPMHALDHDEMIRIAQRQANAARFAVALVGGLSAVANAQAATTTTYGSVGGTRFHATTYNPYLANQLNDQTAAATGGALNTIDGRLANAMAQINGSALQTTTVLPQQTYAGELVVDGPKDHRGEGQITVTVHFADEDHVFHFNLTQKVA